ncbi:MAG TPA: type III-B CRISPR module RAMP protein Cmr1 [bacterium]|nr:type III-B CRISPR module RAMP protein Cmr1 [bacterium]HOX84348.1 type III-B CRISPR module RAMP protein Cmr1 [bacterium]HPG46055.1 type III-B CRISPR module RAMP protein Cmr1 [bacterium]HPM97877.1 type III-B CRISPR module RAMP protein Cmr1 [bacterium]
MSPAMIGGAEARKLDTSLALRPPSIRGQLRFWARALAGGAGLTIQSVKNGENQLFGSIDAGSPIAVVSSPLNSPATNSIELFPHKDGKYVEDHSNDGQVKSLKNRHGEKIDRIIKDLKTETEMIDVDAKYVIRFAVRDPQHYPLEKLKSVVWTWLHLGSIGRRSRRGYGSLIWNPQEKDLLNYFIDFKPERDLVSTRSLANYLKTGLTKVFEIWSIPDSTSKRADTFGFFQLHSLDQVFVGRELCDSPGDCAKWENTRKSLQSRIHGFRGEKRLLPSELGTTLKTQTDEENELGYAKGNSRFASPVLWRLYQLQNGSYVPVMTWSPRFVHHLTRDTKMHDYLVQQLGFRASLAGGTLA